MNSNSRNKGKTLGLISTTLISKAEKSVRTLFSYIGEDNSIDLMESSGGNKNGLFFKLILASTATTLPDDFVTRHRSCVTVAHKCLNI
ncbi:hypothetical protein O9G_004017 [Rozella allomycis CSF55]|uniref:Uncharacterized protein n=1 Tax=Rozella allomycis (strain CSF55) TaxID=988480 RepID=A0A075B1D6_ROZAC|nr:hypothetical protein O9G_004017 [Rozella allomycis CSF55]|eukprot:EPZ36358.1 hypothetical protein O9G_004017 [Rozella allomycis CSF55]